jgi:hypothetical protein
LGVPVIGIGLLYGQGYFRQDFDSEGRQQALYPVNDPGQLPIRPLRQPNGEWLRFPHSGIPESRALRRFRSRGVSLFRSNESIWAQSRYARLIHLFGPGLRNASRERLHCANRPPASQCSRAARIRPDCLATLQRNQSGCTWRHDAEGLLPQKEDPSNTLNWGITTLVSL